MGRRGSDIISRERFKKQINGGSRFILLAFYLCFLARLGSLPLLIVGTVGGRAEAEGGRGLPLAALIPATRNRRC